MKTGSRKGAKAQRKDFRSPLAVARDEFLDGEGAPLCEPATLGTSNRSRQFLRNRIERAWLAGAEWQLRKSAVKP